MPTNPSKRSLKKSGWGIEESVSFANQYLDRKPECFGSFPGTNIPHRGLVRFLGICYHKRCLYRFHPGLVAKPPFNGVSKCIPEDPNLGSKSYSIRVSAYPMSTDSMLIYRLKDIELRTFSKHDNGLNV